MLPKISILIPLHNSEKYIAETIQSAINQTWLNKEIIIVDDYSTDKSLEIAKSFENDMVKVYKNPRKGACAARNYAFEKCTGDFIQYLDADDLIDPDKIEKQVIQLRKYTNHVAVCETWHFSCNIEKSWNTDKSFLFSTNKPEFFFINLWGGNGYVDMVQTSAWLVPRQLILKQGLWNTHLLKDQDGEFYARIVINSDGIIYTPEVRNFYRRHTSGLNIAAQTSYKTLESIYLAYSLKEKYLFEKDSTDKARLAIATQFKILAVESYPSFPDMYKKAMNKTETLGGSKYVPILGGKIIMLISSLLGWKIAKKLKIYIFHFLWVTKLIVNFKKYIVKI